MIQLITTTNMILLFPIQVHLKIYFISCKESLSLNKYFYEEIRDALAVVSRYYIESVMHNEDFLGHNI